MAQFQKFDKLADKLPETVRAAVDQICAVEDYERRLGQLKSDSESVGKTFLWIVQVGFVTTFLLGMVLQYYFGTTLLTIMAVLAWMAVVTLAIGASIRDGATAFLKVEKHEEKAPGELYADDRLTFLRSLSEHVRFWDRDIRLMNRLIDQADLELIPESDIEPLMARLRDDEEYLVRNVEYARRLLDEGPLGTSIGQAKTSQDVADQFSRRLEEIELHKDELRELSGMLAARAEVENIH